jgi:spore coat protein A, manganese oxidase
MLSRRDFLLLSAASGGALLLPVDPLVALARGDGPSTPPTTPWVTELPLPRTAAYTTVGGVRVYDITALETAVPILPFPQFPETVIWGYDGLLPGPTIVAESGTPVVVTHRNALPVPMTVHQHGQVVDGDSDGFPTDLVQPGGTKTYVYPNATTGVSSQMTARTMWYHDHTQDVTGRNVLKGLAAFYLLRDAGDPTDNVIPAQFDVPLVLEDRTFNPDGSLFYPGPVDAGNLGFQGDVVLVNGVIQPRFTVARTQYRLRFLNGSNGRQYNLAFSPAQPTRLIATEGGFLVGDALPITKLFIAQAERYELVVDFTNAPSQVVLQNLLADPSQPRLRNLVRFDVVGPTVASRPLPSPLRTVSEALPREAEATVRRNFLFHRSDGQFEINNRGFDPNRVDATPRAGTTEIWTVKNGGGGWVHPVHIHLINFLILDRDGKAPGPQERSFKETVHLPPGGSARVIMKWPDVPAVPTLPAGVPTPTGAFPPGTFRERYVFHCHNLEHEDHDMMGQFRVLPRL